MENNLTKSAIIKKIDNFERYFSKYQDDNSLDELNKIKSYLNSKDYKIAIIGQMSSGKSTFINSLFGDHILPEANEATTDCAVYIHSKQNIEKKADIYFSDDKANITIIDNLSEEIKKYAFKDAKLERDEKDGNNDLSKYKNVEKIDLYYPFKNIQNIPNEDFGITFIDTPGPNNTGEGADKHRSMTSSILEKANMVIFIFNFGQVDSLLQDGQNDDSGLWKKIKQRYDDENFEVYFVINKIDRAFSDLIKNIPNGLSEEQEKDFIRTNWFKYEKIAQDKIVQAAKKHGIENPKIYSVSSWYQLLYRSKNNNRAQNQKLRNFIQDYFQDIFDDEYEEKFIDYVGIIKLEKDINFYIDGLKGKVLNDSINKFNKIINSEKDLIEREIEVLQKDDDSFEKLEQALALLNDKQKEIKKEIDAIGELELSFIEDINEEIDDYINNKMYYQVKDITKKTILFVENRTGFSYETSKNNAINGYEDIDYLAEEKIIDIDIEDGIDEDEVYNDMNLFIKELFEECAYDYIHIKHILKNIFNLYEIELSEVFETIKRDLDSQIQETLAVNKKSKSITKIENSSRLNFEIYIPDSVLDYSHERKTVTKKGTKYVERSYFNPMRYLDDKYRVETYTYDITINSRKFTMKPKKLYEIIGNNMDDSVEFFINKEKDNYKKAIESLTKDYVSAIKKIQDIKKKELQDLKSKIKSKEKNLVLSKQRLEEFNNLTKE